MKKQILSLVALVAVLASFNTAFASDVPDNMLSKQGEDFRLVGPWDECSAEELATGCYKEYIAMTTNMQSFKIPGDQRIVITNQDRSCEGRVFIQEDNQPEQPIYEIQEVRTSGQYRIINKNYSTCHVLLQLVPF